MMLKVSTALFAVALAAPLGARSAGIAGPGADAPTERPPPGAPSDLAGASWQMLSFQGGDDRTPTPDDRAKYTIRLESDGRVSVRLDGHRGRSTWKSPEPNRLQLGPLALTRAMGPPGSMHDRIAKDWG